MNKTNKIGFFEGKEIRKVWDSVKELWFFSVIDVVEVLTDSLNPRSYWKVLKHRLNLEGSELVTKCNQLKLASSDGKRYLTDVADTETVFRLIQSIPSPKAEPFKLWLAKVGYERLEETEDPELSITRALRTYLAKGYSKDWINQRLKSIEIRKELTDEWKERGMREGYEFALLTNTLTKAWTEKTVKELKEMKGLKKQNLRDHMSNLELVLNMLAETSTTEISKVKEPENLKQNIEVAIEGGTVAKKAREEVEKKIGKSILKLRPKKH